MDRYNPVVADTVANGADKGMVTVYVGPRGDRTPFSVTRHEAGSLRLKAGQSLTPDMVARIIQMRMNTGSAAAERVIKRKANKERRKAKPVQKSIGGGAKFVRRT